MAKKRPKFKIGDCVESRAMASSAWSFSGARVIAMRGNLVDVDMEPDVHPRAKSSAAVKTFGAGAIRRCRRS